MNFPINRFPYTDFNKVNLDWIMRKLKQQISGLVASVNGMTGEVTLTASDVGAFPDDSVITVPHGGTGCTTEAENLHNNGITSSRGWRVVCMGDSWATGYIDGSSTATPWVNHVKSILNLSDSDFFTIAREGCAFNPNHTPNFLSLLEENYGTVTNRDTITHLVIGAGLNDTYDYSFNAVTTGIASFTARARELFPNAKIYLFALGWSQFGRRKQVLQNVYFAYARAASGQRVTFVNGAQYITVSGTLFPASNGSHIDNDGQTLVGRYIANYLLGGTVENNLLISETCTLTPVSGNAVSGFIEAEVRQGKKYFKFGNVNVTFSTPQTINAWNSFDIGTISSNLINGVNNAQQVFPATVRIKTGDDYETRPCGVVFIQDVNDWHTVTVRLYVYGSSGTGNEIFGNVTQIKLSTTAYGEISPYKV